MAADEVIDVYKLAGMERPDLSILSDEFLEGLSKSERPNLQAELLKKLISDKIRGQRKSNVVQARMFSDSSTRQSAATKTARCRRPRSSPSL